MNLHILSKPIAQKRQKQYSVDKIFIERYSPREYNGEGISNHDLFTAFEAARWAPSSLNYQPWRFIYAKKDNPIFQDYINLLDEKNQKWAKDAAALIFVISAKYIEYKGKTHPAPYNEFDAGAAWSNFAHQALISGYKTRGIGGFDKQQARLTLKIPDDYEILIGIAIGKETPENFNHEPSSRLPLSDLVFENEYK